jgi:hypothetical protein
MAKAQAIDLSLLTHHAAVRHDPELETVTPESLEECEQARSGDDALGELILPVFLDLRG